MSVVVTLLSEAILLRTFCLFCDPPSLPIRQEVVARHVTRGRVSRPFPTNQVASLWSLPASAIYLTTVDLEFFKQICGKAPYLPLKDHVTSCRLGLGGRLFNSIRWSAFCGEPSSVGVGRDGKPSAVRGVPRERAGGAAGFALPDARRLAGPGVPAGGRPSCGVGAELGRRGRRRGRKRRRVVVDPIDPEDEPRGLALLRN